MIRMTIEDLRTFAREDSPTPEALRVGLEEVTGMYQLPEALRIQVMEAAVVAANDLKGTPEDLINTYLPLARVTIQGYRLGQEIAPRTVMGPKERETFCQELEVFLSRWRSALVGDIEEIMVLPGGRDPMTNSWHPEGFHITSTYDPKTGRVTVTRP